MQLDLRIRRDEEVHPLMNHPEKSLINLSSNKNTLN